MTTLVTEKQVSEHHHHLFFAEASDLSFPVPQKEWPLKLDTTLGNQQPFFLDAINDQKAMYSQNLGCVKLIVFND